MTKFFHAIRNFFHTFGFFYHATVPLKTSENQKLSDVYRGYRNWAVTWNELTFFNVPFLYPPEILKWDLVWKGDFRIYLINHPFNSIQPGILKGYHSVWGEGGKCTPILFFPKTENDINLKFCMVVVFRIFFDDIIIPTLWVMIFNFFKKFLNAFISKVIFNFFRTNLSFKSIMQTYYLHL